MEGKNTQQHRKTRNYSWLIYEAFCSAATRQAAHNAEMKLSRKNSQHKSCLFLGKLLAFSSFVSFWLPRKKSPTLCWTRTQLIRTIEILQFELNCEKKSIVERNNQLHERHFFVRRFDWASVRQSICNRYAVLHCHVYLRPKYIKLYEVWSEKCGELKLAAKWGEKQWVWII